MHDFVARHGSEAPDYIPGEGTHGESDLLNAHVAALPGCPWPRRTMNGILRLSRTANSDPDIDLWLNRHPDVLHSIASKWFARMRECGHDVRELMHDGCPVACVEDAPFGYVNIFRTHVNVGFFNGAALDDPAGLLEGTGKRMRHVKLRPPAESNGAALNALIASAYLDIKAQLGLDQGQLDMARPKRGKLGSRVYYHKNRKR